MYIFFSQIIEGWKECIGHFNSWKYLLQYPYNDFTTWEFFSYLNQEIQKPYTIYLSEDDFDKFIQMIEDSK